MAEYDEELGWDDYPAEVNFKWFIIAHSPATMFSPSAFVVCRPISPSPHRSFKKLDNLTYMYTVTPRINVHALIFEGAERVSLDFF